MSYPQQTQPSKMDQEGSQTTNYNTAAPVYQPGFQSGYQPGYQPGLIYQPGQPTPIVFNQPIAYPMIFGMFPLSMSCPQCKTQIMTRVVSESGTATWVFAGILCLMGFWCGCQFIPFCIDGLKDHKHFCPNCNTFIGMKRAM